MLTQQRAFPELPVEFGVAGALRVCELDQLELATIAPRKGELRTLAQGLRERLQIELPPPHTRAKAGDFTLLAIGPQTWLAMRDSVGGDFAAMLTQQLGAAASVSDQSSGYAVLRLSGAAVRLVLRKLIAIDLHAGTFSNATVVVTAAEHIDAIVWRSDEPAADAPVFDLAVFRSRATSFWRALRASALEVTRS